MHSLGGHAEARGTVECRVVVLEPRALGCSQKSSTLGVGSEDRAHSGHTPVKIHWFQHKHICGRVMHLLHVSAGWRLLHDWRHCVIRVFTAHQQRSGTPAHLWCKNAATALSHAASPHSSDGTAHVEDWQAVQPPPLAPITRLELTCSVARCVHELYVMWDVGSPLWAWWDLHTAGT